MEFLAPKTGFFCKVCNRFFSGAKEAEIAHCKTQKHYDNVKVRMIHICNIGTQVHVTEHFHANVLIAYKRIDSNRNDDFFFCTAKHSSEKQV